MYTLKYIHKVYSSSQFYETCLLAIFISVDLVTYDLEFNLFIGSFVLIFYKLSFLLLSDIICLIILFGKLFTCCFSMLYINNYGDNMLENI